MSRTGRNVCSIANYGFQWLGSVTGEGKLAERGPSPRGEQRGASDEKFGVSAPSITLPKGGGAISGIGEKFAANPVTGTGSMTVPVFTSPGRSGFGPQLSLSYDSGAGNGPFGFGWNLSVPSITRRTDKGLPKYFDAEESDIFILSGAEDLVPVLVNHNGRWERQPFDSPAQRPRLRCAALSAADRGPLCAHRAMDRQDDRHQPLALHLQGQYYHRSTASDDDARIADPADPYPRLRMAHLRKP